MNLRLGALGRPVGAFAAALLGVAILLALTGDNPLAAMATLADGAFGSPPRAGETLASFVPLALTGLSVAIGFRAGLFNIGAEGQLLVGALGVAALAPALTGVPSLVSIPLLLVVGMLAGAAWGFIPGYLKAVRDANEVITTLMLSYVAFFLTEYLVTGPLKTDGVLPATDLLPEAMRLPRLTELGGAAMPDFGRLHSGVFVALAVLAIGGFIAHWTTFGLRSRLVGRSTPAADYAGIDVRRTTIETMVLSGAVAGLAGAVQVLGVSYRLSSSFSPGFGFTGIAIALLGNLAIIGVLLAALLFAALQTGGQVMQRVSGTPSSIVTIVQGLVILFVATRVTGMKQLAELATRSRSTRAEEKK